MFLQNVWLNDKPDLTILQMMVELMIVEQKMVSLIIYSATSFDAVQSEPKASFKAQ